MPGRVGLSATGLLQCEGFDALLGLLSYTIAGVHMAESAGHTHLPAANNVRGNYNEHKYMPEELGCLSSVIQ